MAKISIIIPVYNVEKFLSKSLNSVICQTLKDIEIICIDDCSSDSSLKILEKYALKDSRFKIIKQIKNEGQGVARNKALDLATGEYIMFLDPDDWLEINACEILYNEITKCDDDICIFNYKSCTLSKENERVEILITSERLKTFPKNCNGISLSNFKELTIDFAAIWCQIYKKDFLYRINARFTPTRTCEDNPFFFNTLCNANTVSVINIPLYNYRLRDDDSLPYYITNWKDVLYNKNLSYQIVRKTQNKIFYKMFIPYFWNSMADGHFGLLKKKDKRYIKRIYKELSNIANFLNTECNMIEYKDLINYSKFKLYCNSKNYLHFRYKKFMQYIFSIENSLEKTIIRILGIKFTIRRNIHE